MGKRGEHPTIALPEAEPEQSTDEFDQSITSRSAIAWQHTRAIAGKNKRYYQHQE